MSYSRPIFLLLIILNSFFASSQTEGISLGGGGLEVEYTATAPVCFGQNSGSIYLEVTGGTPPYNFDWEDMFDADNPQNRIGIFSGSYVLTITDASANTTLLNINVPSPLPLNLEAELIHESLLGLNDGQINLEISNAQWPWVVEWDTNPESNSQNLTNLSPGNYCVTVIDSNNCIGSDCFLIVDAETVPLIASANIHDNYCNGTQNGWIDIDVILGTPPYTFDWLDIPEVSNIKDRANLASGIYSLEIIDSEGLEVAYTYEIIDQFQFEIDFAFNHPTTNDLSDGSISVGNVNGQSPLSYDWVDIISGNETKVRSNLQGGLYCVEVTDDDGCSVFGCIALIPEYPTSTNFIFEERSPKLLVQQKEGGLQLTLNNEIEKLLIFNSVGQLLLEKDNPESNVSFNATSGIYFIRYQTKKEDSLQKFFIR